MVSIASPDGQEQERFSLYVHIPYCQAKCPYCDFNSYASSVWPEADYVEALLREMEAYSVTDAWRGRQIYSVFFGGGTPSLFAPASILRVLEGAARRWTFQANVEITLEANPGTIDLDRLRQFRAAGVSRVSFGVQSFHSHHLSQLGRIHDADASRRAVLSAREAGLERVSLDLIFALPRQTRDEWEEDLEEALKLGTDHISAYNLTYEEDTPFYVWRRQGALVALAEDEEAEMFRMTQQRLEAEGFLQYEISNYARPGAECRHNLNYWRCGHYLGLGAGAHSHAQEGQTKYRWSNERSPARYMARCQRDGHARASQETLSLAQQRAEVAFLGLRCREGIGAEEFRNRFGEEFLQAFPEAVPYVEHGLLALEGGRWRLTSEGIRQADSVFVSFV